MRPPTDREALDEIKRRLSDPGRLVAVLGLNEGARRHGRGVLVRCPMHAERTASCSVFVAPDAVIGWRCHGCGASGDVLGLVAAAHGLKVRGADFRRVLALAAHFAGVRLEEHAATSPIPRPRPSTPARKPPPAAEVAELWAACMPVTTSAEASGYLARRSIDPALVEDRDLARVVPLGAKLPKWARYRGAAEVARSWDETGHRLIVPMLDAVGSVVTLRAWRISGGDEMPKRLPPAGYSIPCSVMADPIGRVLLATGAAPSWWTPAVVLVAEGEPDFCSLATLFGDSEHAPAVLGVVAGSWSQEIAARIPDGCDVVIATDHDGAGERYAKEIAGTLAGRSSLRRLCAREAA